MVKEILQIVSKAALIDPTVGRELLNMHSDQLRDLKGLSQVILQKPDPENFSIGHIGASANIASIHTLVTNTVADESVFIIPIHGTLMKSNYCGTYGTAVLASFIVQAADNPKIKAIVADTDSPGGNVAGVRTLADSIAYARSKKPVVACINDGIAGSGAYWAIAGMNRIFSSHSTNSVGSIGVMIALRNYKAYQQGEEPELVIVYADGSEEKNGEFRSAIEQKDFERLKANVLNPIRNQFVAHVSEHRNIKIVAGRDPLKGGIFCDESSISSGLVDEIGSLGDAVAYALQLSKSSQYQKLNTMSKVTLSADKHKDLLAISGQTIPEGQTSIEVEAEEVFASALNALAASTTQASQAVQQLTDTVTSNHEDVTGQIAELNTRVENVEGDAPVPPKAKKDPKESNKEDEPKGTSYEDYLARRRAGN